MEDQTATCNPIQSPLSPLSAPDAFSRPDEGNDALFYSKDRFVSHLDALALETIERLIGTLVVEDRPVILDLMAGWESHIPGALEPSKVVGLGLNESELRKNPAFSDFVIHDLNREPVLPFPGKTFDVVINTVSVDYMTRPLEVFQEVGRILKPGGLFLVSFSNRMFPEKAVKIWRESSEEERVILVEEFFEAAGVFEKPRVFVSKGKPRPKDDKYAHLPIPSDPVYAVYADRKGTKGAERKRPLLTMHFGPSLKSEELEERKRTIKENFCCPHCGERMDKWAVPENPFAYTWDNDYMYICFNDACPYYVRGWDHMYNEGNGSTSYRLMYNPEKDRCMPVPVPTPRALREGIIDG